MLYQMFTQTSKYLLLHKHVTVKNTRSGLHNNKQSGSITQLIYKVHNSGFHPKDWQSRVISIFHSPE